MPDCAALTAAYISQENILADKVYRRSLWGRPIVRLMQMTRGAYKDGIGTSFLTVTTARNVPNDTIDYRVAMAASNGTSINQCLPEPLILNQGQFTQTVSRNQLAVETQEFCIEDIKTEYEFQQSLANTVNQLSYTTEWIWGQWFTYDYTRLAQNHITVNKDQGMVNNGSTYSTSALPTGRLTSGILEDIYLTFQRMGPDQPFAMDMDTDSPAFALILSKEQSDLIVRQSEPERQDRRFAYMGAKEDSPLLPSKMPSGSKRRVYGGWIHFIDPYPRRFTFNGSAYVEIPAWLESAATIGVKQTLNPAWKTAPYEEVIPFHHSNYRSLAVNTVTNPAPGWRFDPQNYMGDFRFKNIPDRDCNPDNTIGFWRARFADAAEPLNPLELGYTLLVKRCGYDTDGYYCPGDYGAAVA